MLFLLKIIIYISQGEKGEVGVGEPGTPGLPGQSTKGEPGADGMKGEQGAVVSMYCHEFVCELVHNRIKPKFQQQKFPTWNG